MSSIRQALSRIYKARTRTEKFYLVSPLLLAASKDVYSFTGLAKRREAAVTRREALELSTSNAAALAMLGRHGSELVVRGGPFLGMKYLLRSAGSQIGPKIIGSYESEISAWFESAITTGNYLTFCDVGCAEGYYAVGMALRCPKMDVYAFDTNPEAQSLAVELASVNEVRDRVTVSGECRFEELQDLLTRSSNTLLLVDIEGFEDDFLDPLAVPALCNTDIIVELHEHLRPGLTYRILERFSRSHIIEAVAATPDIWKLETMALEKDKPDFLNVVRERRRLPQLWLRMRAHKRK